MKSAGGHSLPLWVVVGPSGSGKTTLVDALASSGRGIVRAVTCTTRPPRLGERDGVDYHFRSEDQFLRMLDAGELVEHTLYGGYRYGLPWLSVGDGFKTVVVVVDPPGVLNLRQGLNRPLVVVGLSGLDEAELCRRMQERGDDSEAVAARVSLARAEAAAIRACAEVVLPALSPAELRDVVLDLMKQRRVLT